jgi:hypothetical protein
MYNIELERARSCQSQEVELVLEGMTPLENQDSLCCRYGQLSSTLWGFLSFHFQRTILRVHPGNSESDRNMFCKPKGNK